jgi:ATP/maltotriose-dependent transcriptional regulator MalT
MEPGDCARAASSLHHQIIWQKFNERSPSEFWRGFASAISAVDREAAGKLKSLGFLEGGLMERELALLLAELSLPRPVCVVLDDYHAVRLDASDAFCSC